MKAYWILLGLFVAYLAARRFGRIMFEGAEFDSRAASAVELIVIYVLATWFTYSLWPRLSAGWEQDVGLESKLEAGGTGFTETSPVFFLRADWRYFTEALESKDSFLLLRGACLCRAIPKRIFEHGLVDHFRELLRDNIPKAKLQKPAGARGNASLPSAVVSETDSVGSAVNQPGPASSTPDSICFKLNWTRRDYKKAFRLFRRRSPAHLVTVSIITIFIFYLISGNIYKIISGRDILPQIISMFPVVILYMFYILYFYFWSPALAARRAADVGTEYDVEVSDSGVHLEDALSKCRFGWQYIERAVETREIFLLSIGKTRFVFFPKRFLADAQEIARLRERIRENVPKARLLSAPV